METIITNINGNVEEMTLCPMQIAALARVPAIAAHFDFTGEGLYDFNDNTGDTEKDNTSANDNLGTETKTAELVLGTNGDTDTETAIVEVQETITGGAYLNVDATPLETYIAIYRQGDMYMKRGMTLKMIAIALIDKSELYLDKGYDSVHTFAAAELNLAEQTSRLYLQTAKKFFNIPAIAEQFAAADLIDDKGNVKKIRGLVINSIFADTASGKDFSAKTLQDIRALKVDTIKNLLETGKLNYDMTGREIREIIKPYRTRAKNENDNLGTDNTGANEELVLGTNGETDTGAKKTTAMALDTIAKLQAELAKLKAANATLQAENDALTNENQQLLDNAAAQQDKIDALTAENAKLKNSNNSYKAANSKAKKTVDALTTENDNLKAENATLQETVTAYSDTILVFNGGTETDNTGDTVISGGVKLNLGTDTETDIDDTCSLTGATFDENVIENAILGTETDKA